MNERNAKPAFVLRWMGGNEKMSAEQTKSLIKQRAELENQLHGLNARRGALYTPGITMVPDQAASTGEQIDLQIEELQAAIAQIDEALKNAKNA